MGPHRAAGQQGSNGSQVDGYQELLGKMEQHPFTLLWRQDRQPIRTGVIGGFPGGGILAMSSWKAGQVFVF